MFRRCRLWFACPLIFFLAFFGQAPLYAADTNVVKIGVLSYRGDDHARGLWQSTADYLKQSLGKTYAFQIIPHSREQLTKAAEAHTIDFAITHPIHYIELGRVAKALPIATIKQQFNGQEFTDVAAVIFTLRRRTDIETIDDLANKALAGSQQDGFGALQMAWVEMQLQGIDPFQDLTRTHVTVASHSDVLAAVRSGVADAGALRAEVFEQLMGAGIIGRNEFSVVSATRTDGYPFVYSTQLYPEWPFVKLTDNDRLAEEVSDALVRMESENIAAQAALIAGWAKPVSYTSVRSIVANLGLGGESHRNIWLWRQFWPMFLLGGIGLMLAVGWALRLRDKNRRLALDAHELQHKADIYKTQAEADNLRGKRASDIVNLLDIPLVRIDGKAVVEYLNPAAENVFAISQNEITGKLVTQLFDVTSPQLTKGLVVFLLQAMSAQKREHLAADTKLVTRDLRNFYVELSVSPFLDSATKKVGAVLCARDVTAERVAEKNLRTIAMHDGLTGLYNRTELEVRLRHALAAMKSGGTTPVLLYLDLDQFKIVNDFAGHNAGDELLRQLSAQMLRVVGEAGTLARLGGDEFCLLLNDSDNDKASGVAERLRQLVESFRFVWQGRAFDIGVSIGVVSVTPNMHSIAEVLQAADKACYAAKDSGRNRVYVYSSADEDIVAHNNNVHWLQRIKTALKKNRFVLDAQPMRLNNGDATPELRFETLIRMLDDQGKLISPSFFIPAAERFKQMPLIDRWVIERAMYLLNEHELRSPSDVRCFINLSGQTLSDGDLLRFIVDCFEIYDIDPGCICFEITETSAVTNFQRARRLMNVLHGIGCEFALDDFGTGLSSFSYLKQLPFDYLKIDGSFVSQIAVDAVSCSVVQAIGEVGHAMGLRVIAEYVENDEVRQKAKNMSLDFVQGYGVAPVKPFKQLLSSTRRGEAVLVS